MGRTSKKTSFRQKNRGREIVEGKEKKEKTSGSFLFWGGGAILNEKNFSSSCRPSKGGAGPSPEIRRVPDSSK